MSIRPHRVTRSRQSGTQGGVRTSGSNPSFLPVFLTCPAPPNPFRVRASLHLPGRGTLATTASRGTLWSSDSCSVFSSTLLGPALTKGGVCPVSQPAVLHGKLQAATQAQPNPSAVAVRSHLFLPPTSDALRNLLILLVTVLWLHEVESKVLGRVRTAGGWFPPQVTLINNGSFLRPGFEAAGRRFSPSRA